MNIPGVHPFGPVGPVWWGVCNTPLHGYDHSGPRARPNKPTGRKAPTHKQSNGASVDAPEASESVKTRR